MKHVTPTLFVGRMSGRWWQARPQAPPCREDSSGSPPPPRPPVRPPFPGEAPAPPPAPFAPDRPGRRGSPTAGRAGPAARRWPAFGDEDEDDEEEGGLALGGPPVKRGRYGEAEDGAPSQRPGGQGRKCSQLHRACCGWDPLQHIHVSCPVGGHCLKPRGGSRTNGPKFTAWLPCTQQFWVVLS